MTVKIDTIELEHTLDWSETVTTTIPRKKIIRKSTPTTQSQYFCRTPREIIITARVTAAIKESLISLKNEHVWQSLYDYDGVTKVDDVWIESINNDWKGDEDEDNPWLVTLNLVCSTT